MVARGSGSGRPQGSGTKWAGRFRALFTTYPGPLYNISGPSLQLRAYIYIYLISLSLPCHWLRGGDQADPIRLRPEPLPPPAAQAYLEDPEEHASHPSCCWSVLPDGAVGLRVGRVGRLARAGRARAFRHVLTWVLPSRLSGRATGGCQGLMAGNTP